MRAVAVVVVAAAAAARASRCADVVDEPAAAARCDALSVLGMEATGSTLAFQLLKGVLSMAGKNVSIAKTHRGDAPRGNRPLVGPDSKFAKVSLRCSGAAQLHDARKENASRRLVTAQATRPTSRTRAALC